MMLNIVLLVTCICIVVVLLLYLFFWNRLVAFILGLILRLTFWNHSESSVWVDLGSIHFSLLTGRVLFKDLRYYSSNQTIKIVKGQISWRYWIRRPAAEEDLSRAHVVGEDPNQKEHPPLTCRVHMSLQGVEWFMYNRTAGYDNIVAQMQDDMPPTPAPTPSGYNTNFDARDAVRKIFSRTSVLHESSALGPTRSLVSSIYKKSPGFVKRALYWIKIQLPNFDPKNLLPMGIEATKGAIICGNASTPSLLVAEFSKAEGTYGIVQARSKFDLYKQVFNLKFRNASLCYVENNDYNDRMNDIGQKVHEHIKDARMPPIRQSTYLSFSSFQKLWNRLKLWSVASMNASRIRSLFGFPSVPVPHPPLSWGWRKPHKSLDDETPVGIDFSTLEYAIERKILEAPALEVLYYADVVGVVPLEPPHAQGDTKGLDPFDIGNGDLPPEWGMDFVVRGGFLRYGPWADRQRVILQQCFFPPGFHDMEPTSRLKPGDTRMWTALKVFIELQDGVTLHIPFREASKDWQWDGRVDVPNRPRKREAASIHIKAGDNSTISYIMPMVINETAYQPSLEVHLDTITVTSSLNDIRLLTAESCRLRCQLPSPLKWNGERQWTFTVSLRQTAIYLLRDHVTMLTDLGKDWSSGPPTDYYRFIPMLYAIDLDLQHYEINMYVNDHNIIDKPLIRDENALLTLRGTYLKNSTRIPILQYRPEATTVSFGIEAPDVAVALNLPRWNTYSLYPTPDRTDIGRIGYLSLNGSHRYHTDVREENTDLLKMDFAARDICYKAFGWTVRHFMILRDNYFGSFTHFSTLYEYLEKRRKGQNIGDPIELQYRPGKSNSMEVEVGVDIDRGSIALPAGLPGYEAYTSEHAKSNNIGDLGSCLLLTLPRLQVQLRTNDYYMEMTLHVDSVFGRFEDHCSNDSLYVRTSPRDNKQIIVIDDIDITGNRLFGPQPRTSTYVCIWEIHVANVKACLSTYYSQLLYAVGISFGFNYSDPLNAPAKEFIVPADPDVTFLKFALDTVNVVWLAGSSAAEFSVPYGLRVDSNDLAGKFHRKVTSLRVPLATCKALLTSDQSPGDWYEVSRLDFDANLDIYLASPGWEEGARAQSEFVAAQDKLTGRAEALYAVEDSGLNDIPGRALVDSELYLPQLRVPSRSTTRQVRAEDTDRLLRSNFPNHYLNVLPPPSGPQSESEGDEGLSEADRDARLANSRPVGSFDVDWRNDYDDILSGEESDDGDLTDPSEWDSDGSGVMDDPMFETSWTSVPQYRNLTAHYKAMSLVRPSLWDGSPFVTVRGNSQMSTQRRSQQHANSEGMKATPFVSDRHMFPRCAEHDVTVIRLAMNGINASFLPLISLVVEDFLKDKTLNQLSPELRSDALLAKITPSVPTSVADLPVRTIIIDAVLSSLRVCSTQSITMDDTASANDGNGDVISKSRPRQDATVVVLDLDDFRIGTSGTDANGAVQHSTISSMKRLSITLNTEHGSNTSNTHGRIGPSTCSLDLGSSTISWVRRSATLSLGKLTADMGHSGPGIIFATSATLVRCFRGILDAWNRSAIYAPAFNRQIVYHVLHYSRQRTIVDPLSTIQPSYLVQKGEPDQLRQNSGFKLIVYFRNCLRYLEASERRAIMDLQPDFHSSVSLRDIVSLVENQLLSQGLEDDISSLSQQPLLQDLFQEPDVSQSEKTFTGTAFLPDIVSLRMMGVCLTVEHPADGARSSMSLGAVCVLARTRLVAFRQTLPSNLGKSYPSLSLRETEQANMQHLALSISFESVEIAIFPQLMTFVQTILRAHRSHSTLPPDGRDTLVEPPLPGPRGRTTNGPAGLYLDAVISINSLRFRAVADKLIVAFSISQLHSASALLVRYAADQSQSTYSTNHTLVFEEIAMHLCSVGGGSFTPSEHSTLASLTIRSAKANAVLHQELHSISTIRTALEVNKIQFNVPRSALRLYQFFEGWQADYLPGINAAAQALLSELHPDSGQPTPPPVETSPSALPSIQVEMSLSSFRVDLQVMPGTWLSWETRQSIFTLSSDHDTRRNKAYSFGLQMGPHIIDISTRAQGECTNSSTERIKLELPVLAFKGYYDESGLQVLALLEFLHVLVEPSDWDILLSVHQKSGQDFDDLLHLIEETRSGKESTVHSADLPDAKKSFRVSGSARMKGFRIGVEGHSSTVFLECDDISGSIENKMDLSWQFHLSDLALSLASSPRSHRALDRGHRSAFVTVDFQANMERQTVVSQGHLLQLAVAKVHAVMQPTSIGELGDFIDHLQAVVLVRQEDRANELAQFKEKTKSIMRSFDVKIGETKHSESSWLDRYSISLTIRNIGVAFPSAAHSALQMHRSDSHHETAAVRAFLFSIKSLIFGTQHGDSGQATMRGFSFQFVERFRQSIAADFIGDSHFTRNRLLYPEMTAHVRSDRSQGSRRIRIRADVSGFILDLDPSISDYVFSLMDVYRQGKERMDRLSNSVSQPSVRQDHAKNTSPTTAETHYNALLTSNILLSSTFASGRLRMHGARSKSNSRGSRALSFNLDFALGLHDEGEVEIFDLPVVSVWGEYRAAPASRKLSGTSNGAGPSILMFKSTIHSSQNTLRPTLLPFITELVNRVESRMRQSSRPTSQSSPMPRHNPLPSMSVETIPEQVIDPVHGMKISLSLRIDQSKLELTCKPDVNVIAGVHWDSGGFMINIAPGARRVTFTGTVDGLTVGLKHGFLSEDCVRLDARNLAFNVTFAKMESEPHKTTSSISVVLDTELLGGIRFSRLQDVLCFKAVWLDRIPIFNGQPTEATDAPPRSATQATNSSPPSSQELTTAVLLRFRSVQLDADLGQSISLVKLDVHDMLLRTSFNDTVSELTLSISELALLATGNVSGRVTAPDFRFHTVHNRRSNGDNVSGGRMLDLAITTGVFSVELDSEYQKLIQYRAEPIEVKIFDDWSSITSGVAAEDRHVDVAFTVSGSEVVIVMNVGTIPRLVSYVNKFKLTLDSQREGASRESKAFRIASSPKPDNALSAVANAMLKSTRSRMNEDSRITYGIGQRMSLKLDVLQVIVFPRSMRDPELAQFVGRDVHARLDRLIGTDALPARRNLKLFFSSISTSRINQLNHAVHANEDVDGTKQWMSLLVKDAHEAIIFGLPSMDIKMQSEEIEEDSKRILRYDFSSGFTVKKGMKDAEDIFITLNMSLYSWLTSLRKTFAREMEQVQATGDVRGAINTLVQYTATPRKRANESAAWRAEKDSDDEVSNPHAAGPKQSSYDLDMGMNAVRSPVSPSSAVSPSRSPTVPSSLPASNGTSDAPPLPSTSKTIGLTYEPRERRIERLTMRQLGEATPDVMHPFFMKKAGFSLEDSLPQYVHEYAAMPTEEIMKALLKIYSKQLNGDQTGNPLP